MDYDGLELELVGVLNTYFGANLLSTGPDVLLNTVFQARQMPEDQTELLQDYRHSLVNVQYSDSSYDSGNGGVLTMTQIYQEELVRIVCYVQCNKMKGASGGYKLLKCIKRALLGYRPTDAKTRMWISSYGDWRIEDGQMKPYLEFAFKTINVQVLEDDSQFATPINSANSVLISGPFVQVDSSLYNDGVVIGVDDVNLHD